MSLFAIVFVFFFGLLEPKNVAWQEIPLTKADLMRVERIFLYTEGPGCQVDFLKPSVGGGVLVTNLSLDRTLSISLVGGKPVYFELGHPTLRDVGPNDLVFGYCIEAVRGGKPFTPALRARFSGFAGIK